MTSRTRLFKELKELQGAAREPDIDLWPDESNIYRWTAYLQGPADTPYAGGTFQLTLTVPELYPLQAPGMTFATKVFHPNVHWSTGEVCLDILKAAWCPAWTLQALCRAVLALLAHPAPDSPLNCDAGNLLRAGDTTGFDSMARCCTVDYATDKRRPQQR